MFTRLTYNRTTLLRITAILAIAVVCHLSAAAASAAPLHDLKGTVEDLIKDITTAGKVVAGLALILTFLYMIMEPMLPQFARENKGLLGRVALGCIGLGLAPDIVDLLFFS